jgi:hypothetical protein
MDKKTIAAELVKLAKEIVGGDHPQESDLKKWDRLPIGTNITFRLRATYMVAKKVGSHKWDIYGEGSSSPVDHAESLTDLIWKWGDPSAVKYFELSDDDVEMQSR